MMKETNIQSQVTSTIAGDDGEAMAKSEGYAIPDSKFSHFSEREFEEKVAPHVTMLIKQMR